MLFLYENLKSANGRLIRESSVKKNFPLEYKKVISYANKYKISDILFAEKLWIYFHDSKGIPKCKCCDKQVRFESYNYGYKTYCSAKCAANDAELQAKKKKTNLERYGSEHVGASQIIKDKIKKTMLEKYGAENPMDVPEFVDKIKKTTLERYGVENIMHLKEFKDKCVETNLNNNDGTHSLNLKETRDKRNKIFDTRFRKKYIKYRFIESIGQELKLFCGKCDNTYEIYRGLFKFRADNNIETCTHCNSIGTQDSYAEQELKEFISSLGVHYTSNDRHIISPKELDIVIEDKKIAIEYNGLFWHSDKFVDANYHLDKTNACKQQGYTLLHIFEDEWIYKKPIVKSIIKAKAGASDCRIHARKCIIAKVSAKEAKSFLELNHIQGYVQSSHKYGLYYNGDLAAIMTFGNLRKSLGAKSKKEEYELLRYASKLNTIVVGGASRLFKHFINRHNPNKVISYANRRYFSGNMYTKLGMVFLKETRPNYFYYNGNELKREQRFKYRKSELVKEGFDSSLSEREIMKNLGYYRIYDSGNYKYEWNKA